MKKKLKIPPLNLKIRFQRFGKRNNPYYYIVLAHKDSPVKGKIIDRLGWYNLTPGLYKKLNRIKYRTAGLNIEKLYYWLSKYKITFSEKILKLFSNLIYTNYKYSYINSGLLNNKFYFKRLLLNKKNNITKYNIITYNKNVFLDNIIFNSNKYFYNISKKDINF